MSFSVGDTIGDYEILGVLGRGGMGAVYRVRNLLSHREEAMKIALPDVQADSQAAERFLREIRVQASLRHPNIAELRTAVRVGDHALMILELIEGESIAAKLKLGRLPFEIAFRVIDDILGALAYAHQHGVVHRDIKPDNIMVTSRGQTKLTDFGIARAASEDRITQTNVAVGSLNYMAPEQIRSNAVDERSDLYSLGVTFYEMLTGRLPVEGRTLYELMEAHRDTTPVPPAQLVPGLAVEISDVIMRSLAKTPSERYHSAQAFQTGLRNGLFGEQVTGTVILPATSPPHRPIPAPVTGGTVPSTLPPAELQRVEKHLAAAIGPIAKNLVTKAAQRHTSLPLLYQDLANQISDPAHRATFLRAFGASPDPGSNPKISTAPSGSVSQTRITEATIESARKALAGHLGPMAGIVVNRAAKGVRSAEELADVLAADLPDERARKAFRDRFKI